MASTWGSNTWSSNSWGSDNNIVSVTGIGATFSLGDESSQANADVIPTSLPITANQGNENIVIATTGDPAGIGATFSLGTADAGPDAMVTGLDTVTASVGTVDAYNIEGWGRQQWNSFAWGITGSLLTTGEQATANVGSITEVTGNASVIPTGIPITSSLGDESIEISFEIELTGQTLTTNLGIADAGPDAMLEGIGATGSIGSVEAYNLEGWGRYFWGQFEWGATGEWESVELTGIALSANVGSLAVVADANTDVNGEAMTAEEGTVDPAPDATVTGIGFNASLAVGTVVAGNADVTVVGEGFAAGLGVGTLDAVTLVDLTGITMSASVGGVTVIAEGKVTLTGLGLTMAEGTNRTLIWNQVNTGTAPTWTEVDTAA
ncbi:MAG: hypothetical protein V2I76_15875 [Roseobacter sp.]|jgi:hypothetical protein|nr:hypothetical protein [Roseobacter sp.]